MSDIHSLLIVGTILGIGGMGLFMYKADEECDDEPSKEENEKIEDTEQKEENEKKTIKNQEEPKYKHTKKNRKRGGGATRRSSTFRKSGAKSSTF
jgi:hypothetical protein